MIARIVFSAAVAVMAMTSIAAAQQPTPPQTIKRTLLQKFDVPGPNYETVIGLAEIMPNSNIGRPTTNTTSTRTSTNSSASRSKSACGRARLPAPEPA